MWSIIFTPVLGSVVMARTCGVDRRQKISTLSPLRKTLAADLAPGAVAVAPAAFAALYRLARGSLEWLVSISCVGLTHLKDEDANM